MCREFAVLTKGLVADSFAFIIRTFISDEGGNFVAAHIQRFFTDSSPYPEVPRLKNSNHPEQTRIMTEYALQKVGSK